MPLALTAKFTFHPRHIIDNRWVHDLAHDIVATRCLMQVRLERRLRNNPVLEKQPA